MTDIRLSNIEFRTIDCTSDYFKELGPGLVPYVTEVGRAALSSELNTWSDAGIETLLPTFDTLVNPNLLVDSGRLAPNQLFIRPTLSLAFDTSKVKDLKIVGYAFSADDASGPNPLVEKAKMLTGFKSRWLGQVAVSPAYQRRGIGTVLGLAAFHQSDGRTHATASTWPKEGEAGTKLSESLGLNRKEEKSVRVAGYDVHQVRFFARRAQRLVEKYLDGTDPMTKDYLQKVLHANRPQGRARRERKYLNYYLQKHQEDGSTKSL